jgi:hypothetical protein
MTAERSRAFRIAGMDCAEEIAGCCVADLQARTAVPGDCRVHFG